MPLLECELPSEQFFFLYLFILSLSPNTFGYGAEKQYRVTILPMTPKNALLGIEPQML